MVGAQGLDRWLRQAEVTAIVVVSPHLDDAAFSLAGLLGRPDLPPRRVVTVITEAAPDADPSYARACGFTDPEEEFRRRRDEDAKAMATLDVPFIHAGVQKGRLELTDPRTVVPAILAGSGRPLVLLPAGAGRALGPLRRLGRRLRRKPVGCVPHAEHVWVRDALRTALSDAGVPVGYYGEIPYRWADTPGRIATNLLAAGAPPLERFALRPDADVKLAACRCYASQVEPELGRDPRYQRRTVSLPELLLLPLA